MLRWLVVLCTVFALICSVGCSTRADAKTTAVSSPAQRVATPARLLDAIGARTSQAGASASVAIRPSTGEVVAGQTVSVDVQALVPAPGLGAWTIEVQYDPAVLSASDCATPQGLTEVCNASYSANSVLLAGIAPDGLAGTQTLATLTFTGLGVAGGMSDLTVALDSFVDPTGADIAGATTSDGLVTIAPD